MGLRFHLVAYLGIICVVMCFFYNIVGCMLLDFVLYVGEVLGKLRSILKCRYDVWARWCWFVYDLCCIICEACEALYASLCLKMLVWA